MIKQNGPISADELDAMLYVLDDPSLDRSSFEARLENDPHLAELVAQSVELAVNLIPALKQPSLPSKVDAPSHSPERFVRYVWLAAIAASILILASSWSFFCRSNVNSSIVAQAWSELQPDSAEMFTEDLLAQNLPSIECEGLEPDEDELPDWLLVAATRSLSNTETLQ